MQPSRRCSVAHVYCEPLHRVFAVQVICAGSLDTFQVYVWSVRTGRLLDVLAGHEGPVAGLAFSPTQPLLASASWDKTVRTWDVFRYCPCVLQHECMIGHVLTISLDHSSGFSQVLTLCYNVVLVGHSLGDTE